MTGTKENGYILKYDLYNSLSTTELEFKTLKQVKDKLDEISERAKVHIIWYTILKKFESGTYTDTTYNKWWKSKTKHNIPERRI